MNTLKLIKDTQGHEDALSRLLELMDLNPGYGSDSANELDVLALLIESYEEEAFHIESPDPITAIIFRMEQEGLERKDLATYIGSASKISEVLNRKRPLSLNMIRRLSKGLGISADILINEPLQKKTNELDIDWKKFPLAEMRKRNYFPDFTGSLQDLKEYAAERVGRFLSNGPEDGFSLQPALLRTSAHLRSNNKVTDSYALWAWQVRVLKIAQENPLKETFKIGSVDLDFMKKLAQESWSERGPLIAKEFLNKNGIHLIIEPHFKKTYLDGAACKTHDGHPIIALSLRHDRLDSFWFTLMHELAHISLHLNDSEDWFIDDLDVFSADKIEQEADDLAKKSLIPIVDLTEEDVSTVAAVIELSKTLNIHPCILAWRIRYENENYQLFGNRFREKVKDFFN